MSVKTYRMTADGVLVVDYAKLVVSDRFQQSLRAANRIMVLQRKLNAKRIHTAPGAGQERTQDAR